MRFAVSSWKEGAADRQNALAELPNSASPPYTLDRCHTSSMCYLLIAGLSDKLAAAGG